MNPRYALLQGEQPSTVAQIQEYSEIFEISRKIQNNHKNYEFSSYVARSRYKRTQEL
jgi:hypothetical protein